MLERPTMLITQSLLLLVTLLIGILIGGAIGYLLGQSCPATVEVVPPATASTNQDIPVIAPSRNPEPSIITDTSPAGGESSVITAPTASLQPTELQLTMPVPSATEETSVLMATTAIGAVSTTASAGQPSIPLPEVITLTPTPKVQSSIEINESQANEMATRVIAATPELGFLSNPTLRFFDGMLELRATSSDPTGQLGRGELVVRGRPEIRGVRVVFRIDDAQIAGRPVPVEFYPRIEAIIGGIFRETIGERPANAVEVKIGVLRVMVTEPS